MFNLKILTLFTCAILGLSEAKFVDSLTKCSIDDGVCLAALLTSSIKAIHKTGVPELGIPPIDPLQFQNLTVSILDLIELVIPEGEATGVKDCVVDTYTTEIDKGRSEVTVTCNSFIMKAKYNLNGTNPLLKTLFGGETIHGEGNAKVEIEKLRMRFNFYFDMDKNKDGDIIFNWILDKTQYFYEVLGKVGFAADNIFVGDKDASQQVVDFMNENANFVMNTFGKTFVDKAMEFVYLYFTKFFQAVPAKYYIVEDLSKYIKP